MLKIITKERYILKLKKYAHATQYTYTRLQNNRKFSTYHVSKKSNSIDKEKSLKSSISRSISNIKEYILCNEFEYFFTLTLKTSKRNDIIFSSNYIINVVKKYAKTRKHFKYLYVFEKQKRGGLHIHGFFSGFDDLYFNKYGHLSSKFFDKVGFHCLEPIDKVNPFYLIKYISKEPIKELKHRYYHSRNLKKAEISYLHCDFDEFSNFVFTFENGYCKMVTIHD